MQNEIIDNLRTINDGRSGKENLNIVDTGMVSSVRVEEGGHAIVILSVSPEDGPKMEGLRQAVERSVAKMDGVSKVSAILTAEAEAPAQQQAAPKEAKNPQVDMPAKHIIAVASGKGGVGKSTVAANLAVALAKNTGLKVGLLDADIYGPSLPVMMGNRHYKPHLNASEKLIPAQCHGVSLMSIGFLVDQSQALIWRGPMAQTAFYQLIRDVDWAEPDGKILDVLVIDLPPGTGDIQLTMIKKLDLSGAVIVSTPQDIALIDARRAIAMFEKMDVPILGLIENMSVYVCPECGHEAHIFGEGGARAEAKERGVHYLGDIPLARNVREHSDEGMPIVLADPEDSVAQKINEMAGQLQKVLSAL